MANPADAFQAIAQAEELQQRAIALQRAGRHADAEDCLHEARELLGGCRESHATAWSKIQVIRQLAANLRLQRRLGEAELLLHEALAHAEEIFGAGGLEVASLCHELSRIHRERGRPRDGETFARRALEIRTAELGADHPEVAATAAAVGSLLVADGRPEEAESLLRAAMSTFEACSESFGEEVADIAHDLALIQVGFGDLDMATSLYERALDIRREVLGESHPAVAKTLHNLALLHERAEHWDQAAALWAQAATIARNCRDTDTDTGTGGAVSVENTLGEPVEAGDVVLLDRPMTNAFDGRNASATARQEDSTVDDGK